MTAKRPADTLGMTEDEMRRLGYEMVDLVVQHLVERGDEPAVGVTARGPLEARIGGPVPRQPSDAAEALATLHREVLPKMQHGDHPRYFARVASPAAFTGISGIKPTYGRCSRWGIVAFASSLDQAGPMARDVRDCAIMLEAMAGFDPKDATSLDLPVPEWEAGLNADLRGKKVGVPAEYRMDGMDADVAASWDRGIVWLQDAGAEIVEISLPHTKYALPTYYIVAPAEASSNLARYDGVRYGLRVPGKGTLERLQQDRLRWAGTKPAADFWAELTPLAEGAEADAGPGARRKSPTGEWLPVGAHAQDPFVRR